MGQEWDYVEVKRGISASDNDNLICVSVQVKLIPCVVLHLYLLRPAPRGVTMTPRLETFSNCGAKIGGLPSFTPHLNM